MKLEICRKLVRTFAVVAILVSPAAVFAAAGSFEETVDVDGVAIVHVSNDSGAIEVIGDDVDQVFIRAVKRSPPLTVEGGRIEISKLQGRYQRHASISYEIVVPRDSDVNVHSVSGNVKVSGVAGSVNATSENGKVTLADSSAPKKAELSVSALRP
jgi:hypothetical protein